MLARAEIIETSDFAATVSSATDIVPRRPATGFHHAGATDIVISCEYFAVAIAASGVLC